MSKQSGPGCKKVHEGHYKGKKQAWISGMLLVQGKSMYLDILTGLDRAVDRPGNLATCSDRVVEGSAVFCLGSGSLT